ncbi:Protein L-Myc-1-A, partial [Charadrius vociferus]
APSEDIWKKFELVPTPPLSPLGTPGEKGCCSGAEERSGCLSRYCLAGEEPEYLIGTGEIFGNLSAFILKDCMWSGFSARERLEKAMTEKLSTGTQRATPYKPSFAQDFGAIAGVSGARSPCCPQGPASCCWVGTNCNDNRQGALGLVKLCLGLAVHSSDNLPPAPPTPGLGMPSRFTESVGRTPSPLPPPMHHGGLSPLPAESAPAITLPEPGLPKAGSSPGSDSEDVAKRKNHNYLERKRRNDLRSRFLALRDQVPGLASCPKTPKVVILSKSSEYLQSLISAERRMAAEKRQLRLRQTQLLKRIAHLKGH